LKWHDRDAVIFYVLAELEGRRLGDVFKPRVDREITETSATAGHCQ
jgi:hypothetical protein